MAKPPIFLLGVPRSGTTLLRTILNSHAHLACGPEAPWLARHHPLSVMAFYERLVHDPDAYCQSFAMPPESARLATRAFVDDLFTRFAQANGKTRWAHKTPDDILYLDFFVTLFPEAKYVHLVRHPLDVALSTTIVSENRRGISDWHAANLLLEPGVILENDFFSAVVRWKSWNRKIEQRRPRMDYHRVQFEDLLKDPQPTLAALFEFLDEPFDADCLDYARVEHLLPAWEWGSADVRQWKTLQTDRADRWQKEMSPTEITVLGSVAQPPEPPSPVVPQAALGSAEELATEPFRLFMEYMNRFATRLELRTFADWSKVWEYPWLWFHGLSQRDWSGQRLVDLGSEISPMPWFLATLGARVTLIETDPQWIPRWEALRRQLDVDVEWHIVDSERLPLADAQADALTSFSVIEHQPDKRRALDEVARVLKPGGLLAISFDICEPEMGMTFPEWNGRALTLREFEESVWEHPTLDGGGSLPAWNLDEIPAFRRWHLQSAPHHNYVVGAAVLNRRATA